MFWIVAVQLLDHGVVLRGEDHIPTVRLALLRSRWSSMDILSWFLAPGRSPVS
jgi:hypothetical protein